MSTKLKVVKPIPEFKIASYGYEFPDLTFNLKDVRFRYKYDYEFDDTFSDFSVGVFITMSYKKKDFSHIMTVTRFHLREKFSSTKFKNPEEEKDSIQAEIKLLPSPITTMVYESLKLSSEAMLYRQKNTQCEGVAMPEINWEELYTEIGNKVLPQLIASEKVKREKETTRNLKV